MGSAARLPADQARRQVGNEFKQFGAWHLRAYQGGLASLIHAMHGKDVLGQINSNGYDSHDFPFQVS